MRVKLGSMSRWKKIPSGQYLDLPGKRREVTLEVNVEQVTRFDVVENNVPRLLRVVEPRDCPLSLLFIVDGDCEVVPNTEGEVWYYTDDGETINYAITTQSFTKLEQRMEMTPEMEVTILKANLSRESRLREQAQLMLLKKQRDEAEAANADPETGEIVDGETIVEPDGGTSEQAPPAGDGTTP